MRHGFAGPQVQDPALDATTAINALILGTGISTSDQLIMRPSCDTLEPPQLSPDTVTTEASLQGFFAVLLCGSRRSKVPISDYGRESLLCLRVLQEVCRLIHGAPGSVFQAREAVRQVTTEAAPNTSVADSGLRITLELTFGGVFEMCWRPTDLPHAGWALVGPVVVAGPFYQHPQPTA